MAYVTRRRALAYDASARGTTDLEAGLQAKAASEAASIAEAMVPVVSRFSKGITNVIKPHFAPSLGIKTKFDRK